MIGEKFRVAIFSASPGDTFEIGKKIGSRMEKGDIIALIGELGTGKTLLTSGIARGLNVPDIYPIASPTFTLINEYPGRLPLYHFDVYRLDNHRALEDVGYEEYFYGEGVVVIEWAEKIISILPENAIYVELIYIDENSRDLIISGKTDNVKRLIQDIYLGG
ncbi:MAG: tRNA (adenosine(37)-N6)-threonylcarbamoyltransferase complex ATPase subunit type 1 TsaE [Syntrophales bacterium]|nr:tRNA (adenosine(37)-N6)-threonylcarbamoyltransferase complex ATPase subunit type 1 TsaE [Syntrophales bacterium]